MVWTTEPKRSFWGYYDWLFLCWVHCGHHHCFCWISKAVSFSQVKRNTAFNWTRKEIYKKHSEVWWILVSFYVCVVCGRKYQTHDHKSLFIFYFIRYGCWATCFTYGCWFGVEGLVAAGESLNSKSIIKCAEFLLSHQRENGGEILR